MTASHTAYAGDVLKKARPRLHAGDLEPYPDSKRAAALLKAAGKHAPKGLDADGLAETLQEAWRAFHAGLPATPPAVPRQGPQRCDLLIC